MARPSTAKGRSGGPDPNRGPFRSRPTDGSAPSLESDPPLILGCPWPPPPELPPMETPARRTDWSTVVFIVAVVLLVVGLTVISVVGAIVGLLLSLITAIFSAAFS